MLVGPQNVTPTALKVEKLAGGETQRTGTIKMLVKQGIVFYGTVEKVAP